MENINISHPEKLMFPDSKITKNDVVEYYINIADQMLPHLKGRPVSIQRYPNGIDEKGFYQKEASDHFPTFLKKIKVKLRTNESKFFISIENKESLAYLANLGTIPIHAWLSCKGELNKPDMMMWDFDPTDNDFEKVRQGAFILYDLFKKKNIEPLLKTTGSRGLHVIIPIKPNTSYLKIRTLAKKISIKLANLHPELLTTEFAIADRGTKVFVDYFRNSFGQTAIAPYSIRPLKNAPVAAPITWKELEKESMNAQFFTIKDMEKRIKEVGYLFEDFQQRAYTPKDIQAIL